MICLRAFDPTMASNRKLATRNLPRFPGDFGFQLTAGELRNLRSQIATSSLHGGRRYRPWAFTEHGAIMLGSVLNSEIAVQASIRVVRAFVRLREMVAANAQLAAKLKNLSNASIPTMKRLLTFSLRSNNYLGRPSRQRNARSGSMYGSSPGAIGRREYSKKWQTRRTYGAGSDRSATPRRSPKRCRWWLPQRCAKRSSMHLPGGLTPL